jgi:integrase
MLNAAIEDGLIASNPAAQMGRALKLTVSKVVVQEQIKAMTLGQLQAFLTTANRIAPRVYCLLRLLSATGMRLGEALGLQYEDIDFSVRAIRISRAFSEDGTLETPKSGHGRSVEISESLAKMLVVHEMVRRQEKDQFCWTDMPPWLFVTTAGTPVDPANVRRSMQRILKEAHLPLHFTPHCLRHTYASILLAEGTPAPYVQEQLGHASIELTVSTYGRWLKKKAPGALDRLDVNPGEELSTGSGSKVVAIASYSPSPLPSTNLQAAEIPWKEVEPATRIERATCGLRIAMFPTPARQIKKLAVQIAAKPSSAYAIPQLAATRIPLLLTDRPIRLFLTRSSHYESTPRSRLTSKSHHPESQNRLPPYPLHQCS